MMPAGPMRVSIVIPTHRRPELLERCLVAVTRQSFPAAEYEVLIADDAADSATRLLVERMARTSRDRGGPEIGYVAVTETRGPAGARNAGAGLARGAVLAFTDDDTIPSSQWLACGVRAIEAGADAVTGRTIVPLDCSRPSDYERDVARLGQAEFVTANCFIRASVFQKLGGFDERFTRAWREDSDLHFRLLDGGYAIDQAHDAIVVHPVRRASWGVSLRQQRKSQDNALLYKKHPERYRERIQSGAPIAYYVATASLMVLAGAHGRHSQLSRAATAIWSAVTLRFAARRLRGASLAPGHVAEMLVTSALIPPLSIFWRIRGAARQRVLFF